MNGNFNFGRAVGGAAMLAAAFLPGQAFAEETETGFDLEGSVRARYEVLDGNFRPGGQDSEDAVVLRTLIEGSYQGEGFKLGATLQDSRAYANDIGTPLTNSDINALELIELYAALDVTDNVTVTLGRQAFSLGSKRLVGNPGWRNAATAFTGARIDWQGSDRARATAFYVMPQQRLPSLKADLVNNKVQWDLEDDDLTFWGAFYQRPGVGPFTIEAYVYGLDEGDRVDLPTRNRHLVTPGARLFIPAARGHVDTEWEGAWQMGDIRTGTTANAPQVDVNAYLLHGELGYTFDSPIQPRLALFGDLATGDDAGSASFNKFDPLFGPRWTDFGPTGLFGPISYTNMRALGVRAFAKFSPAVSAQVNWRKLWLDSATEPFSSTGVRDATGAAGRDAGSMAEIRASWQIVPDTLKFEAGAALLAQGRFFDLAPNATGFGDSTMVYSAVTFEF